MTPSSPIQKIWKTRIASLRSFQKALALAAGAPNRHEAAAAERAARKLMVTHDIDPVVLINKSLYDHQDFTDNALLQKLRDEWRAAHPHYSYKIDRDGCLQRLPDKPKPKPVNTSKPKRAPVSFGDFEFAKAKPKPKPESAKPVNTSKPSSDRNRDRHSPGYMRDYMRRRRELSRKEK